jgi:hypothetical protein
VQFPIPIASADDIGVKSADTIENTRKPAVRGAARIFLRMVLTF